MSWCSSPVERADVGGARLVRRLRRQLSRASERHAPSPTVSNLWQHLPLAPENVSASLEEAQQLQRRGGSPDRRESVRGRCRKTERALAVRRQYLGDMHPDVAYSLSRLGNIAYYQGQYQRAEALISEALNNPRSDARPGSPGRRRFAERPGVHAAWSGATTSGRSRCTSGRFGIYETAPASARTSAPAANLQALIADVLNNLGRLYYTRGDYSRAESQYLKASRDQRDARSDEHRRRRDAGERRRRLLLLATVRQGRAGAPARARHPGDAPSAQSPVSRHQQLQPRGRATSIRETTRARSALFQRALAIDEASPRSAAIPRLATRLFGLAEVLRLEGEYARADPLYERALAIRERSLGPAHPDVAATLIARSLLRYATGDFDGAIELMSRGADLREETLALVLTTGSEDQKRLYLRTAR